ncbi:right-handed parallel beta-helix repeat-containing protein [Planctomycetales bacterium ZRK34]|nr:right-handed parallel beta-helix repeat-containing protein [Planctomycetales bacterium ZRK34]
MLLLQACSSGIYVAPGGDDANAGTYFSPFATLARARQAAAKADATDKPVTVILRGGVYQLAEPIVFGPEDSGTPESPITYRAASGEKPVLSGGRPITGWQVGDDGIWRTTIPAVKAGQWSFSELFVDGTRATRARFPNEGYLHIEQVGEDNRTNFTYTAGDLPDINDADGAQLVFLHDWSISRVRIASIDPKTRTVRMAHTVGPHAKHYRMNHYEPHPRYFLENSIAFLDAPGEWYLNTKTGVLAYKPLDGQKPGKVNVVAPALNTLMQVVGTTDKPVHDLVFKGLSFEHCVFDFGERYAAGQAAFHEEDDSTGGLRVPTPAALPVKYADRVTFTDITIAHVGGSGMWVSNTSKNIDITRMHVHDTGGNGLMIGTGYEKHGNEPQVTNINVTDSVFEHVGKRFFGAIGVWIGMADHVNFEHNLVRYTPYTGVSLGWQWNDKPTNCGNNTLANNHIHHNMQTLSDGGGIYTLGRMPGTKIIGNVIHDIPRNAGRAESNGIFFDQGSSDMLIADNVIFNTDRAPFRFHQAKEKNISRNNLLVHPADQPVYRYNRTEAEVIVKENDRPVEADKFDPATVQDAIKAVGPR